MLTTGSEGVTGRAEVDPSPATPGVLHFGRSSVVLVVAFWSVWGLLMGAGLYFSPTRDALAVPTDLIAVSMLEGYLWAALTFPLLAIAGRVDLGERGWWLRVGGVIGLGLVLAVGVAWVVPVLAGTFLFEFSQGVFADPAGRSSAFRYLLNHDLLASLLVLATGVARAYMLRYQVRQEEATRLRAQLAESRLRSLRMQLNPHFLFNTMNTIAALVAEDPKGVRTMIARLSGLLRDTLDGAADAEITVSKELEMVERYLGIVAVRFQGRLETRVVVEPRATRALVPNFILQPLVENAVKHAVVKRPGTTLVRVEVRRSDDVLILSVIDNGPGIDDSPDVGVVIDGTEWSHGLGLAHTRERLSAMYGSEAQLLVSTPPEGGTAAVIRLPYRTAGSSSAPAEAHRLKSGETGVA
jgi:two-component system LytT family sensor kinase